LKTDSLTLHLVRYDSRRPVNAGRFFCEATLLLPFFEEKHYPLSAGKERYFQPARLHLRHNHFQKPFSSAPARTSQKGQKRGLTPFLSFFFIS
jgi:hypothetical protein